MSKNRAPKTIYLQYDPDGETTWCDDKINDDDIEYVQSAIVSRLDLAEQVCYALVAMLEHDTWKCRMVVDAALTAWKREAAKGGEE